MNIDLLEWCRDESNHPRDEMKWKEALWSQVLFARDTLAPMLRTRATVIGHHTSKSITCPVYKYETPWATIVARYNYHDWNVSIKSKVGPLDPGRFGTELLFERDTGCGLFFQGMNDWKFKPWDADKPQEEFSVHLSYHYQLFTYLHALKIVATETWNPTLPAWWKLAEQYEQDIPDRFERSRVLATGLGYLETKDRPDAKLLAEVAENFINFVRGHLPGGDLPSYHLRSMTSALTESAKEFVKIPQKKNGTDVSQLYTAAVAVDFIHYCNHINGKSCDVWARDINPEKDEAA